jgi:pimeloyl-ACP methyl ester carboxylesterase
VAQVRKNNSTTVRTVRWALRRAAIGAVRPVSSGAAARMAARWFFMPDGTPGPSGSGERGRRFEVRAGELRLAAWEWGRPDDPAVILAHGWNGRGAQLVPLARAIAARGYRAVTFDQPAHGRSSGRTASIPNMAEAIAAVSDAVGGAEAIVAHSLGAVAATYSLSRGVVAERVVFVAPPVSPARWIEYFAGALGIPEDSRPELLEAITERAGVPPQAVDPLALAPAMSASLLVIHDQGDREVPVAAGAALARAWPGGRLVVTSGLGHNRLLADPEVIAMIADAAAPERSARALVEMRDPHLAELAERVAAAM